jgi:CheY-like chemotaxis protein
MTTTSKRVLLVDDDIDFITVNKMALEAAGYAVATAYNGKDGLRLALEGGFDAAVLDVIMTTPDEGFELARSLRKDPRTKKLPLIMLTSVNAVAESKGFVFRISDRDRDDMWLPVDKFVDKPIKADRLIALVRELTA